MKKKNKTKKRKTRLLTAEMDFFLAKLVVL
jgi:hypothetical protein